jgi:hypothetical protein
MKSYLREVFYVSEVDTCQLMPVVSQSATLPSSST